MHHTRIKICGMTSPEDAAAAVEAGADAVGVVFAQSSRQVDLARACDVLSVVPEEVVRVGVFVDDDPVFISEAADSCGLGEVQLHGDEPPDVCSVFPVRVVKAFRVGDGFSLDLLDEYRDSVDAVLLDGFDPDERGGTGRTFEWGSIGTLPDWVDLIVAGGLNPANVASAMRHFRPFGVDVSSGVEEWPGNKDRNRMRAFVTAVRDADAALGIEAQ